MMKVVAPMSMLRRRRATTSSGVPVGQSSAGPARNPTSWCTCSVRRRASSREDAIAAICFVSEHEALKGPLNLVAPEPVSNEEFSHALGRALHRPSSLRAPAFALRALFGEGADPLLTGQRVLPTRLEAAGFTFRYPKLDDALRDCLGPER